MIEKFFIFLQLAALFLGILSTLFAVLSYITACRAILAKDRVDFTFLAFIFGIPAIICWIFVAVFW